MSDASTDVLTTSVAGASLPRRFVIAGTPALYQEALKALIETRVPNSRVTVADTSSVVQSDADVVILDLDSEDMLSLFTNVADLVKKIAPKPVLLMTTSIESNDLQRLLRDGVAGVVLKSSPSNTLLDAIESVSSGSVWLQRDLLTESFADSSHVRRSCSQGQKIAALTERERQIIAVVSCGLTNRQAGEKLHISEPTVRHHLSSIFSKLGVANRGELIIFAYRHRLVDDADRSLLC
jgi:two-component system nitrate/nitrite response regulator NarL